MSKGIRLSDQHGVNPSIDVCFFCGEDKGIVMFGKLKGDVKAPKRIVSNYTPCPACEEKMAKGTTIIEVTTSDTGALPIQKGAWPTGRWCVISHSAADKLFKQHSKTTLLEDVLYNKLLESREKAGNVNERTDTTTQ